MPLRLLAILNPASGVDEPVLAAVSDVLGAADVEWEARVTTGPGDAETFAREALGAGFDRVLAYGGDGTVSAVANELAGSDVPLAILPGGTGNAVAQELGVPLDLREAVALAAMEDVRLQPLDALVVDGRRHLLRIGVGADARMIEEADREAKDRLGWFAYLLSAIEQVRNPELARYVLELDGERVEVDALSVLLVNVGRIGRAGLRLAEDVAFDDGLMDVFAIRDSNAESVLAVTGSMLGLTNPPEGGAADAPLLRWRVRHAKVHAEPEQAVQGDGEVLGRSPLEVRLEAATVRVVVPR